MLWYAHIEWKGVELYMYESQKKAAIKYKKNNIKRVPLDMQLDFYDRIKSVAESLGMPVNTYIKNSIMAQLDKDDPQDS